MSMGGEIRRHASITKKVEDEMQRRKETKVLILQSTLGCNWKKNSGTAETQRRLNNPHITPCQGSLLFYLIMLTVN